MDVTCLVNDLPFLLHQQKPSEKYVEEVTEHGVNAEQKRWEEDHLSAATLKFGARDAKSKKVWVL